MAEIDPQLIDQMLDKVLRASGSALRRFTLQKRRDDMRQAMREVLQMAADLQLSVGAEPLEESEVSAAAFIKAVFDCTADMLAKASRSHSEGSGNG